MGSTNGPRVSVCMAVYNRADLLPRAIESVLGQTFRDFELLIVDDASTDESVAIARRYADPRIRLVRQREHAGIPRTRTLGLVRARGDYLAILDSDDEALPRRLEKQVAFLDRNPEVAAVGGFALRIHRSGRRAAPALRPTRPRDIRARVLFTTCFKNPTMMARTAAMREIGYREEFVFCQDIDMWSRMSARYPLANLPEFLIRYRLGGSSHQDAATSARLKKRTAEDQLRDLGVAFDAQDVEGHHALRNPRGLRPDGVFIDWCEDWLTRVLDANRANPCYPEPELTEAAAERWWRLAVPARAAGVPLRRFALHPRLGTALPKVMSTLATTGGAALGAALRAAGG